MKDFHKKEAPLLGLQGSGGGLGFLTKPSGGGADPNLPSSAVFYATGEDFTDRGPNTYTITKVGNGLVAGNTTSNSGNGSFRFDGVDTNQYFYAGNNTFLNDSLSSWQHQCWARYDNTTGGAGNSSGDMGILVDQYESGQQGRLLYGFQDNELVMRVNGGNVELRGTDNNGSGLGSPIFGIIVCLIGMEQLIDCS